MYLYGKEESMDIRVDEFSHVFMRNMVNFQLEFGKQSEQQRKGTPFGYFRFRSIIPLIRMESCLQQNLCCNMKIT